MAAPPPPAMIAPISLLEQRTCHEIATLVLLILSKSMGLQQIFPPVEPGGNVTRPGQRAETSLSDAGRPPFPANSRRFPTPFQTE